MAERRQTLEMHDVSDLIGLRVIVANAVQEVIDDDNETSVEVPDIESLSAAAAVVRCLTPIRLLGAELRAIRKIAGWTAAELAAKMGEKTSWETISRWENEKQPMGGYAEKVFRLVVCEALKEEARGVGYEAGAIAKLIVIDPWRTDQEFRVPPMVFDRVKVRENRAMVNLWEPEQKAA